MMPAVANATSFAGALNAEGRFYMWGRGYASNSTVNNATPLGDGNAATDRTIPVDLYTVGGSPFGPIPQSILTVNCLTLLSVFPSHSGNFGISGTDLFILGMGSPYLVRISGLS